MDIVSKYVLSKGYNTTICSLKYAKEDSKCFETRCPVRSVEMPRFPKNGLGRGLERVFKWLYSFGLCAYLPSFDIVHIYGYRNKMFIAFFAKLLGKKVILHFLDIGNRYTRFDAARYSGGEAVLAKMIVFADLAEQKICVALSDHILCHGYDIMEGLNSKKAVFFAPIVKRVPKKAPGKRLETKRDFFLVVTRLEPEKGVYDILDAYSQIDIAGKPELVIIGDGSLYEKVEQRCSITKNCAIFRDDDVASALSKCFCLVQAATFGGGIFKVLLEALIEGKLAIISDVNQIGKIVEDEKSALIFPPGNVAALKRKMEYAILRKKEAVKIAENGQLVGAKFEVENEGRKLLEIYKSLRT